MRGGVPETDVPNAMLVLACCVVTSDNRVSLSMALPVMSF